MKFKLFEDEDKSSKNDQEEDFKMNDIKY